MILATSSQGLEAMDQADRGCQQMIREAQLELGAFSLAVRQLHGEKVALHACDLWLEELTSLDFEAIRRWRSVTMAAASRLAQSLGLGCKCPCNLVDLSLVAPLIDCSQSERKQSMTMFASDAASA
jgi:hypothetical protein